MLDTTIQAMRAILRTDPTVSDEEISALVKSMRNGEKKSFTPEDRVLTRSEIAEILRGKSLRYVDYLASAGQIKRVIVKGRSRGIGFSYKSVSDLIDKGSIA